MADITIDVPDAKLETLVESIGRAEEGQDDAARIEAITGWVQDTVRQHLWNY